jgi:hypothetical protein
MQTIKLNGGPFHGAVEKTEYLPRYLDYYHSDERGMHRSVYKLISAENAQFEQTKLIHQKGGTK